MIAQAVVNLLQKPEIIKQMLNDLACVKLNLGDPGAADRAAKLILSFLQE